MGKCEIVMFSIGVVVWRFQLEYVSAASWGCGEVFWVVVEGRSAGNLIGGREHQESAGQA